MRQHVFAQQCRTAAETDDRHAVRVATTECARERRATEQRRQPQRLVGQQDDGLRVFDRIEQGTLVAVAASMQQHAPHVAGAGGVGDRFQFGVRIARFRNTDHHDARLRTDQCEQAREQVRAAFIRIEVAAGDDQAAIAVGSEFGGHRGGRVGFLEGRV